MPINRFLKDPLFLACQAGMALQSAPLGFIDMGARGGIISDVEPLAGVMAALGFDPDHEECAAIAHEISEVMPYALFQIAPFAVGKENGSATMNLYKTPVNNSFLKVNPAIVERYAIRTFEEAGSMPVQITSLDSYLFQQLKGEGTWGELLKLDTQGMEHDILSGATRTLAERTVAVIAEVEFFQIYSDQPLFSEVELLLRARGFSFYGFSKMSYRSRRRMDKRDSIGRERVLWADAIFFKDPFPGGFCKTSLTERGNYALFACALLLGYFDFALELALNTWAKGEEAKRVQDLVMNCAAHPSKATHTRLRELLKRVEENPALANIELGKLVDEYRFMWDYDDMVMCEKSCS